MGVQTWAAIIEILIEILNLGEQIGMFFVEKASDLSENEERTFFFILVGIGGASMLKSSIPNERILIFISLAIETGELLAYILSLKRSTALYAVASVFYVIEFILHLIIFALSFKNEDDDDDRQMGLFRMFAQIGLKTQWSIFITSLTPLTTLYLHPESHFRKSFYEFLVLLILFTGGSQKGSWTQAIKTMISGLQNDDSKSDTETVSRIYIYWGYFMGLFGFIISALIAVPTTFILACLEIRDHGKGLPKYDLGLHIVQLIFGSISILSTGCLCCFLCSSFWKYINDEDD
jgi:hypothetical protein